MSLLEALLLGTLQGLTEFLPVSSSGHLVLAQHFLGLKEPQVLFDVMLHLGTLIAVVAVYRRSLAGLLGAALEALTHGHLLRRPLATIAASRELRLLGLLVVGSIPTALIGLLFKDRLEAVFADPRLVAGMLIVTGLLLQAPRLRRPPADGGGAVGLWQALVVGTVQGLAITPGISRSGSTISAALLGGVAPAAAAEYSFLLSIPAILGAALLKLGDAAGAAAMPSSWVVAAGVAAACAVGYVSLVFLLAMLRRGRFALFSYYCFALGLAALIALG